MNKLDKYESMKDYILESLDETVIKLEELKKRKGQNRYLSSAYSP